MFGFNFQAIAIAAVLTFGGGVFVGGEAIWKLWDVSAKTQEAANLRTQLAARDAAAAEDAPRIAADAARLAQLEELARHVETIISNGQCLSHADADGLRSLWK